MGFETLLGNQRLKENLITSLRRGRTAHFYLISGPDGSGKRTLAKLLSAALLCQGEDKPCLHCSHCRKVLDGVHPDLCYVEDPEHKNVAVRIVRQMREDMFIRPNEGDKKIYVFPQELGIEGQNALLKILEEPPAYGVFLLLTDNPEKLLPTVRSRCVELPLLPLEGKLLFSQLQHRFPDAPADVLQAAVSRSGGYFGQALALLNKEEAAPQQLQALAEAMATGDGLLLLQTLVPMEKWKRDQFLQLLQQWLEMLEGALACRGGAPALSPMSAKLAQARSGAQLLSAAQAVQRAMEYAKKNVSVAAICGWLQYALR